MTTKCLRATCDAPAQVQSAVASYLQGIVDVQLMPYKDGTVLLPPDVLHALEMIHGPAKARSVLAQSGFHIASEEPVSDVIHWFVENGEPPTGAVDEDPDVQDELASRTSHLEMCKVREAWNALPGGVYDIDWVDVTVGQIDTGYTEHPVFGFPDHSWIDRQRARTFGKGADTSGRDPLTGGSAGHGTSSGSLICAYDMGTPCLGVAPRVPLVHARISDCVIIDDSADTFEAAVRYLVDDAKVNVINVSMGTFLCLNAPEPIRRAVDHAYEKGVIMIAASGNVPVAGWRAFPARLHRCIAVAGVTSEFKRWALSSYGDWIDFSGPAKNIWRAETTDSDMPYGFTASFGGTTFAAAMTSGAAALWLLRHAAEIATRYTEPWQRVEAFRKMACTTALTPEGWTLADGLGAGVLNVEGLMDSEQLPAVTALQKRR
jgi:hypothetical protein